MSRLAIAAITAIALAGCVTPYGPKGPMGGYTDFRVRGRTFFVSVDGNGYTDRATLTEYFHRRAREICGGPYEFKAQSDTDSEIATFGRSIGTVNRHSVSGYIECAAEPRRYISSDQQAYAEDDADEYEEE